MVLGRLQTDRRDAILTIVEQRAEPRRFDMRIKDGRVEVFDGAKWVPYREVIAEDPGPLVRDSDVADGQG